MKTVALEEVCKFSSGGTPDRSNKSFYTGDIPWITGADIIGDRISPRSFITNDAIDRSAAKVVPTGTVLLVTRTSVGKVTIADRDLSFSQDITALTPLEDRLDRSYLVHFLRYQNAYLARHARGATIKGVTRNVVAGLRVPELPLSEQRRAAAILNKADGLRAKRHRALSHLDAMAQSIFYNMFGNPASDEKDWGNAALPQVAQLYSGGTPSKDVDSNWTGTLPWFSPKDLKADRLFDSIDHINEDLPHKSALRLLPPRTVVFVVRGMILAHTFPVSLLEVPATINQDMKAVIPKVEVLPDFLLANIQSQSRTVLANASSSAHGTKRLDASALEMIRVLLPPLRLQQEYANRVAAVERLKEKNRNQLAQLNTLFAALQDQVFKGNL